MDFDYRSGRADYLDEPSVTPQDAERRIRLSGYGLQIHILNAAGLQIRLSERTSYDNENENENDKG